MPVFKIDLHHHCSCDPVDSLLHTDFEIIDRALACGLNAIAITPHASVYGNPEALTYARSRGLLLIAGVEKMIEGREIVLLNVTPDEVPRNFSFDDLKILREKRGDSFFVFAPHPFYPRSSCAGPILDRIAPLIDAVEYAHLYFSFFNLFNQRAARWASLNNKPLIANSDSHHLSMVARNYTVVEADELSAPSLFTALKSSPSRLVTGPYSLLETIRFFAVVILPLEWRKFFGKRRHSFSP